MVDAFAKVQKIVTYLMITKNMPAGTAIVQPANLQAIVRMVNIVQRMELV